MYVKLSKKTHQGREDVAGDGIGLGEGRREGKEPSVNREEEEQVHINQHK